jgi:hypothetical protein
MKSNILLCCLLALFTVACKKENDPPAKTYELTGLWMGTYTTDQFSQNPPYNFSFIIKPGGDLLTESKVASGATYYSKGTWTLTGDTVRCTYTSINFPNVNVTQSAKLVYNKTNGTLTNGTWKDEQNGSNYTGKFQNLVEIE